MKGYQEVSGDCLLIPKYKVWNRDSLRFVCIKDYYEMKDESCGRPKLNERYDEKQRIFKCEKGFYRNNGGCDSMPENSVFVPED